MSDLKEKELKRIADQLELIAKYLKDIAKKYTENTNNHYY